MRFRLIVLVVILLMFGVAVTVALLSRHDGPPRQAALSPDCQHVDTALRAWGRVVPDVQQMMGSTSGIKPDTGKIDASAADVRTAAALVESGSMRADVLEIADGLDTISRAPAPAGGLPSSDVLRGWNETMSAAHQLVLACPGVGDPAVPGMPVRPSS